MNRPNLFNPKYIRTSNSQEKFYGNFINDLEAYCDELEQKTTFYEKTIKLLSNSLDDTKELLNNYINKPQEPTDDNAWLAVLNELRKIDMFTGKYDSQNGDKKFMYGIQAVMEQIAYNAGEEAYTKFELEFTDNLIASDTEEN